MKDREVSILMLCTDGDSSRMISCALRRNFGKVVVVCEDKIPRRTLLQRRVKKFGLVKSLGQVAFLLLAVPFLKWESRARRSSLLASWKDALDDLRADHFVDSANTDETRSIIARYAPDIVVISGTRILSRATLECTSASFINMHAGLTPRYRGVHGGYWALAEERADLVGTTVHLVDSGIDTGAPLEQVKFTILPTDNYCTYPILHTLAGLPSLITHVRRVADGEVSSVVGEGPSHLWYHPTILQYLWNRLVYNVR